MMDSQSRQAGDRGHQTLLGFDFGTRRIGVAVGQTLTASARALTTVKMTQQKPDWDHIGRLIAEWQPQALIVGIPLTMHDTKQPMTDRARAFARKLAGRYRLPVHGVDERLSSRAAREQRQSSHDVDPEAARVILETWLNEHSPTDTAMNIQRTPTDSGHRHDA